MVTAEEIKKTREYKIVEEEYSKALEYARECDIDKTFVFYGSATRLSESQLKKLYEKYPDYLDYAEVLSAFIDLVRSKREEIVETLKSKCGCKVRLVAFRF